MIRTRVYRDGVAEPGEVPVEEVVAHLGEPSTIAWVDLSGDDRQRLDDLAERFGLHELDVDAARDEVLRPKLRHHQHHLFVTVAAVEVAPDGRSMEEVQLNAFQGPRWLLTVHDAELDDLDQAVARWDGSPGLVRAGTPFLLDGLLDVVVDSYFRAVSRLDATYDTVAEAIFSEHLLGPDDQRRWFLARQTALRLHRLAAPMREVVGGLLRQDASQLDRQLVPYYQELFDHALRVAESIDAQRELVSSIVDTNLVLREHRTNKIMKRVTGWAAIIAVPTLITGYYGMNVPYPGVDEPWGFAASVVALVTTSLGLYLAFRRNDWL